VPWVLACLAVLLVGLGIGGGPGSPITFPIDGVSSSDSQVVESFTRPLINPLTAHEVVAQPCTATIAESVCVVCWGAVGDAFRCSGADVTKRMRRALKVVGTETHLVGEDEVVG